jgi:hypothetical protein
MICKCGYNFAEHGQHSYAVVNDADYPTFLQSEIKAAQANNDEDTLTGLSESSQYVGCLLECPECGRLLLIKPSSVTEDPQKEFYVKDE